MNRITYTLALLVVMALAVGGCGGDGETGGYGGRSATGMETGGGAETSGEAGLVSTAEAGDLGTILVDAEGLTLYDFHKDEGTTSSCYGACAEGWPPLLTARDPQAQGGAIAAKLGTTERKDGTTQVTYAGHPLYTYVGDEGPGEANGHDVDAFGAEWYALQPSGQEPED